MSELGATTTVDTVLVHWEPPVPADVRGHFCGEIGIEHVDVRTHTRIGNGEYDIGPHVSVEVYLAGFAQHGDTYGRRFERVDVRPPGRIRRALGATLKDDVDSAIRSRAAIVRDLWRSRAEVGALRR